MPLNDTEPPADVYAFKVALPVIVPVFVDDALSTALPFTVPEFVEVALKAKDPAPVFIIELFVVLPDTVTPGFIVPLLMTSFTKLTLLVPTLPPVLIVVLPSELEPSPSIAPVTLILPVRFETLLTVKAPGLAPVVETAPVTVIADNVTP